MARAGRSSRVCPTPAAESTAHQRPFRAPLYPVFPITALIIALLSLIAIVYYNAMVAALFTALGAVGAILVRRRMRFGSAMDSDPLLQRTESE